MTILVIAEHDHGAVQAATRSAIAAAQKIGGDIHVLIAGHNASGAANAAAQIPGSVRVAAPPGSRGGLCSPPEAAPGHLGSQHRGGGGLGMDCQSSRRFGGIQLLSPPHFLSSSGACAGSSRTTGRRE